MAHGQSFARHLLPHPTCSLTVELGSHPRPEMPPGDTVVITGVVKRRFDVEVRGWGRVVGVRFRPGGLAALTGRSAHAWTERVVPAREALPADLCAALADPDLAACPGEWATAAEAGLLGIETGADPRYEQLLDVVADMLTDRSLLSVAEAGKRHGFTPRTLQRLFTHYVGVGPKWVLTRVPDARRRHRPRRGLRRDAHRPGPPLRLVRPGPLRPRLHRARRGHARPVPTTAPTGATEELQRDAACRPASASTKASIIVVKLRSVLAARVISPAPRNVTNPWSAAQMARW